MHRSDGAVLLIKNVGYYIEIRYFCCYTSENINLEV